MNNLRRLLSEIIVKIAFHVAPLETQEDIEYKRALATAVLRANGWKGEL